MKTREFHYDLPEALIAQQPCPLRDRSRLLVLDRKAARFNDHIFTDLPDLLPENALLVLNDSRVFPARLRARKSTGGAVEVLLVAPAPDPTTWRCLCRSSKPLRPGTQLTLAKVHAEVQTVEPDGAAVLRFEPGPDIPPSESWFLDWVQEIGETPLPPYIRRPDGELPLDRERYQTVYAQEPGSIAAPTAGLHFTPQLIHRLIARGLELRYVTLHVGPGTFRPVRTAEINDHRMDTETAIIPQDTARAIARARAASRPVIAVGTTTVRTLEDAAEPDGSVHPGARQCALFITPGHEFRVIDGLVTNFHLPESTLLMLVAAFAGRESILAAYHHAVAASYRFYSYGDAMLIQ